MTSLHIQIIQRKPLNAIALPYPKADKDHALMTQAGVGLCAYKTTEQKQEAASVFAHWLVEPNETWTL